MNRTHPWIAVLALVTAACRNQAQANPPAAPDTGARERAPVHLSPEQARAIGVAFAVVERGPLMRTVRTLGQIVPAEPNLAEVTTKFDGFVDQLLVNATGSTVRRGQPLLTIYSPMLVAAQEELLAAKRLASLDSTEQPLVEAARRRLAYWDISREQIELLERTGEVTKTLTFNAPAQGIVLEKLVTAGQAVTAGTKLYRIADLSSVWIEAAVFEQDLSVVRTGSPVSAEFTAYPGRTFTGRVSFVWPTVDEASRSGRVRVAFANPRGELRPGMYATLLFDAIIQRAALNVPADAVVQTGARNLVFVVGPSGAFEPREVVLGARAGDRFQIVSGVAQGDRIVASANFLVDAESRLTAGQGGSMPEMHMGTERRP